jgi:hypothetical protein
MTSSNGLLVYRGVNITVGVIDWYYLHVVFLSAISASACSTCVGLVVLGVTPKTTSTTHVLHCYTYYCSCYTRSDCSVTYAP